MKRLIALLLVSIVSLGMNCQGSGPAGSALDVDTDGDGIPNITDNCPYTSNPAQEDSNGSGIGDLCEGSLSPLAANLPPVANAGPDIDQDLTANSVIILHGENSYDPNGSITSYVWQASGGTIYFGSTPNVSDLPLGVTTLTLEVTDNDFQKTTDTVQVTLRGPKEGLWTRTFSEGSFSFFVSRDSQGMRISYFYYNLSGRCLMPGGGGTMGYHKQGAAGTGPIIRNAVACSGDPALSITLSPSGSEPVVRTAHATLTFSGCPGVVGTFMAPQ